MIKKSYVNIGEPSFFFYCQIIHLHNLNMTSPTAETQEAVLDTREPMWRPANLYITV